MEVPRDPTSNDRERCNQPHHPWYSPNQPIGIGGKQLFRQLSTVGSDLVASLKLFTELHDQAVILAEWWTFLQVQIGKPEKAFASAAMTEILPMSAEKFHTEDSVQELAGRWSKVKAETFGFYNTVSGSLNYGVFSPRYLSPPPDCRSTMYSRSTVSHSPSHWQDGATFLPSNPSAHPHH